jgi:hypothetical protein
MCVTRCTLPGWLHRAPKGVEEGGAVERAQLWNCFVRKQLMCFLGFRAGLIIALKFSTSAVSLSSRRDFGHMKYRFGTP